MFEGAGKKVFVGLKWREKGGLKCDCDGFGATLMDGEVKE